MPDARCTGTDVSTAKGTIQCRGHRATKCLHSGPSNQLHRYTRVAEGMLSQPDQPVSVKHTKKVKSLHVIG